MAVKRPRGYSCEEIDGAGFLEERRFETIERLSVDLPLFMSPNGTGSSRYVDVFAHEPGYVVTCSSLSLPARSPSV